MFKKGKNAAWIVISLMMISALLVGCSSKSTSTATTGTVGSTTESSTIETSGNITAKQQTTLSWEISGIVGAVNVKTNQEVKKGDTLMSMDPTTAPSDVITAEETLVTAKQNLEDVEQSNTTTATAEVTLASAQSAYNTALSNYWNRKNTVGSAASIAVYEQELIIEDNKIYDQKQLLDSMAEVADNNSTKAQAVEDYNQMLIDRKTIKTTLDGLRATPNAQDVQTLLAALDEAKAALEDAQRAYDKVKNGPSTDDIASAQAKVDAAQSTVNELSITAPFAGEVVAVLTQVGDQVTGSDSGTGTDAIILVDRSSLYIDVLVDETDISKVKIGDTATITYSALPDLTSTGKVTFINPVGSSSSGVVNYTVRVTLDKADPQILIGATATVVIETGEAATELTVPISAVQSDDSGEYVMRVKSDGTTERVTIVSGTVTGTSVVVTSSSLKVGDTVQLVSTSTSSSSSSTSSSSSSSKSSTSSNVGSLMGGGGMGPGGQ